MQEENPFNGVEPSEKEQKYYFIELNEWVWTKSDDLLDKDSEPFYDFSEDGRIFCSENNKCPVCGVDAVFVSASGETWSGDNVAINSTKDWCCLLCGVGGDVVGNFGEQTSFKDEDLWGDFAILPSHVVVTVGK